MAARFSFSRRAFLRGWDAPASRILRSLLLFLPPVDRGRVLVRRPVVPVAPNFPTGTDKVYRDPWRWIRAWVTARKPAATAAMASATVGRAQYLGGRNEMDGVPQIRGWHPKGADHPPFGDVCPWTMAALVHSATKCRS